MTKLPALTEDPPREDSPDLTDAEVEGAVFTKDTNEFARLLTGEVKQNRDFAIKTHELRRRGDHLYARIRLVSHKEPDKVLVFQVDWLQGDEHVLQQQRSVIDHLFD